MKKILYISHVSWGWIKQRPHFIAEGLNEFYDVTVITRKSIKKDEVNSDTNLRLKSLFRLPLERFSIIRKLNTAICRYQLKKYIKETDIIWLTHPLQYKYIKGLYKDKFLVYDCMDDMLEFSEDDKLNKEIKGNEGELFSKANRVYASSQYLKDKLISRYHEKEIMVVNNAIKDNIDADEDHPTDNILKNFNKDDGMFVLSYIGTISEWFDFDLIKELINKYPNLKINLFGPNRTIIPEMDRLCYCGTVEHKDVFAVMKESDGLIMPFILNELILSVNPVKLYEYIYSGKPCLAPLYPESLPFKDYVFLYEDVESCVNLVGTIINNRQSKCEINKCKEFARNNTWGKRVEFIKKDLACL